jgi:NAD(P)-dependent dehydrogenase (short-subunit alcohol dehydrogenase family)
MPRLGGKVALITGAGTGIGRACALLFAREGARVALVGRRAEPLAAVAQAITGEGGEALAIGADMTRAADVGRAVQETVARFAALHVLVNNAGAVHAGTVETTSEAEFQHLMDANVKSIFLMSRAALPELRKAGGSIVNIGSVLGLVGIRNRAAYCAAKGAVTQLTRAMALDHASEHVRVNCICPNATETEMLARSMNQYPDPQAARRARAESIPLGRFGQPEEVAHLALYLASDEAAWMTGAAIPLDGGVTAS